MDTGRDSLNPSLKDASSLTQLVDSVVAEVHQSMLNEPISCSGESLDEFDPLISRMHNSSFEADNEGNLAEANEGPKIIINEDEKETVRSTTTNEEEELSEFWDQVINYISLYYVKILDWILKVSPHFSSQHL